MFEYTAPAGLSGDTSSTKTEQTAQEQPVEAPPAVEPKPKTARPTWLELLEDRADMPGLGSQRLPTVATIRAYHKAHQYVPGEAELFEWPARIHGGFAVAWAFTITSIAWAGAGDYRRRLRTFKEVGLPGLVRAQLPPLRSLSGLPRVWVALWSALAWSGLKFWRPIITGTYVLMVATPVIFSLIF